MNRSALFDDQHGPDRRRALAKLQRGMYARKQIRRFVIAAVLFFIFLNVMAALNPYFHRNDVVRTACTRSMT